MNSVRRMNRTFRLLLALAIGAGLSACQMNHLVFTTYTKVGLDITFSNATPGQIVFGYKRFEGAIVPVRVPAPKDDASEKHMAPLYAAVKSASNWTQGTSTYQDFATGAAAEQAALGK